MAVFFRWLLLFMITGVIVSCHKEKKGSGCFENAVTIRKITNQKAVVQVTGTIIEPVYLVAAGSIDERLIPCNLPVEFYQSGLQVTISGEVKSTQQSSLAPCCSMSFVISKISR